MAQSSFIPMFPLTLLPLPGELVPLHIFEPRYKQLLQDAETLDISFGIYFNHDINKDKVGALMKLESIIKRYPTGESDIIVKCVDAFSMEILYRTFNTKMYPGGDVRFWNADLTKIPSPGIYELFLEYQSQRNINQHITTFSLFQIAAELGIDFHDRYKFLTASADKQETFIFNRLKFQLQLLEREEKSKDVFHLN